MKKVGIITTFRQSNWGSVLQAYALQKIIDNLGHNSELIDYIYPNDFHWNRGKKWGRPESKTINYYYKKLKTYISCALGFRSYPMMTLLNRFISNEMKVSKTYHNYTELHSADISYDTYVTGSDQVWNPNTMLGDMSYMFDFTPKGSHKISYASSFSCLTIPDKYKEDYIKYLKDYSAISVRENNGKKVIYELLNRDAIVVLDPTLLLTKSEWATLAYKAQRVKLPSKYILCYMLSYTFDVDKPMGQLLEAVQTKYKMPVIALNCMPKSFIGNEYHLPKRYGKGIYEFLYLIENASIVVSSSFHGAAFSLNFGRPLVALAANNEDDRLASLLDNLGLSNLLILDDSDYTNIDPFYDVFQEQQQLQALRDASQMYLSNNI